MSGLGLAGLYAQPKSKVYMLSWDATVSVGNWSTLHTYIRDARQIEDWWYHLPFLYLIKSSYHVSLLSADFKNFFGDAKFFICEIIPENSNGWLPAEAWNWIHRNRTDNGGPGLLSAFSPPGS